MLVKTRTKRLALPICIYWDFCILSVFMMQATRFYIHEQELLGM